MSNGTQKPRFQLKRDISTNWEKAINFIPREGEPILYTDLNMVKFGDGVTSVNDLSFADNKLDSVAKIWYKEYEEDGTKVNQWQMTYTDDLSNNVYNQPVYEDDSKITLWRDNLTKYPVGKNSFYENAIKNYKHYNFNPPTDTFSYDIVEDNSLKISGVSYKNANNKIVFDGPSIDFISPINNDYVFMFDFKFEDNDNANTRNTGFTFNPFKGYYFDKPWTSKGDILRISIRKLSYKITHRINEVEHYPIDKVFPASERLPAEEWLTFQCILRLGKIIIKVWNKNSPSIIYINEEYNTSYITHNTLIAPKQQSVDVINYVAANETNNDLYYGIYFNDFRIYRENVLYTPEIKIPDIPNAIQDIQYNNSTNLWEKFYLDGTIKNLNDNKIILEDHYDDLNQWSYTTTNLAKNTEEEINYICEAKDNKLKLSLIGDTITTGNRAINLTSKITRSGAYAIEFDYKRTAAEAQPVEIRLLGSNDTKIRAYIDLSDSTDKTIGRAALLGTTKKNQINNSQYLYPVDIMSGEGMNIVSNKTYHIKLLINQSCVSLIIIDIEAQITCSRMMIEPYLTQELLNNSNAIYMRYGNVSTSGIYSAELNNFKCYQNEEVIKHEIAGYVMQQILSFV